MPFGEKTPAILAAEIRLHRDTHSGAFLVVEGSTDMRFWRKWRDTECELVDGEGKLNVLGVVQRLDSHSVSGILGMVDSDYDTFVGADLPSANLVATDAHDLECLLCRSDALDAVLHERGDPRKIARFQDERRMDVRQALLERALAFGRVRLAATLHDATDVMPEISVARFLDERNWTVDADTLLATVATRSGSELAEWRGWITALVAEEPWYVARGHDMVEILRAGLKRVLGDLPNNVGVADIAKDLRLAAKRESLEGTGMWAGIRSWENSNAPFSILAT